jgi:hypothetical protein
MERRNFLKLMFGAVSAAATVRTFPFRVFSFAKEIKQGNWEGLHLDPYPGRLCTPNRIDTMNLKHWFRSDMEPVQMYNPDGAMSGLDSCISMDLILG